MHGGIPDIDFRGRNSFDSGNGRTERMPKTPKASLKMGSP